ncbi:AbrB family transcriptional regulator, partial [Halomonas sp. SIMBA_159]
DVKSANVTIVSVMQTFRILLIVFTVPLAAGFLSGRAPGEIEEASFQFSPYAFGIALVAGYVLYWIMKRISFPARELMAPVL